MIFGYTKDGKYEEAKPERMREYIWFDLLKPTMEDEAQIENILELEVPTREEMAEIELSNRLYQEDGALFLTAVVLTRADTDSPVTDAITFVITGKCLVTLRYEDLTAFKQYISRLPKTLPQNHVEVFNGVVEAIINRMADILERIAANIENISRKIFHDKAPNNKRFEEALSAIGSSGDLISKQRESIITMSRALSFASNIGNDSEKAHIASMVKDMNALSAHADFLSNKVTFLLDATLGMLNFEQNNIIKIFTLAAIILMPPTLIAGIYGMNFDHMPELRWYYGYTMALVIMLVSAFLPYRYFKKKGWI